MPGSVDAGAVSDMAAAKRASGQGAMRAFLWRKRGNGEERCEQCRNERQEEGTRGWQTTGRPKERNSDEGRRHGRPSCFERCRRRCWGTGGPQVSCTVAFLPVLEAWPMHEVGSLGPNAQRLNPKRASEPASRNLLVVGAALAARAMPSENQTVSLRTAAPVCSCSCEHARCVACRHARTCRAVTICRVFWLYTPSPRTSRRPCSHGPARVSSHVETQRLTVVGHGPRWARLGDRRSIPGAHVGDCRCNNRSSGSNRRELRRKAHHVQRGPFTSLTMHDTFDI